MVESVKSLAAGALRPSGDWDAKNVTPDIRGVDLDRHRMSVRQKIMGLMASRRSCSALGTVGADAEGLSIEDANTTWPDELTSCVDVARIDIKALQSPYTPEAFEHGERLAFSPWHSLAANRPLGGINRLRKEVYATSASHRRADGY